MITFANFFKIHFSYKLLFDVPIVEIRANYRVVSLWYRCLSSVRLIEILSFVEILFP